MSGMEIKKSWDELLRRASVDSAIQGVTCVEALRQASGLPIEKFFSQLADFLHLPFFPDLDGKISEDSLRELPLDFFKTAQCFPLDLKHNDFVLYLATIDPFNLSVALDASALSGMTVQTVLTLPTEIQRLSARYFEGEGVFQHSAGQIWREYEQQLDTDEENLSVDDIRKRTESEPVVKMVDLIFDEALRQRASDIHVEPGEQNAVVRFRIDGMLKQHMQLSRKMYVPFTSRVKVMADLDIAEKRIPQDGRIRYNNHGRFFDCRVSTLPTHFGEKSVIRILKHDQHLLDLEQLGISAAQQTILEEIVEKPQGMIFVTGPTGSGKSSTLFACLNRIRTKAINITTIENPIEYKIEGINQVQINDKAGVTFASTLRSVLRQDPDVILIGEIRDGETAEISIQASQTGHLVFSTLHTNDSVSAITRLRDLGIPSFLISSALVAIIAQRLVRVLCPFCKHEGEVSEPTRLRWNRLLPDISIPKTNVPVGCDQCSGIGYRDRTALFEIIVINDSIRDMIAENIPDTRIRQYLRENHFSTLITDGLDKIAQGVTTPDELLRVVMIEDTRRSN